MWLQEPHWIVLPELGMRSEFTSNFLLHLIHSIIITIFISQNLTFFYIYLLKKLIIVFLNLILIEFLFLLLLNLNVYGKND